MKDVGNLKNEQNLKNNATISSYRLMFYTYKNIWSGIQENAFKSLY